MSGRSPSLRRRLAAAVVGTVALAAGLAVAGGHAAAAAAGCDGLDALLTERATAMQQTRRPAVGGWNCDPRRLLQVLDADGGGELMRSSGLPRGIRLGGPDTPSSARFDRTLPDGRTVRVLAVRMPGLPDPDEAVIRALAAPVPRASLVLLAQDRGAADAALRDTDLLLAGCWVAAVALAAVAAVALPGIVLRPVDRFAAGLAAIRPDGGPQDLQAIPSPDELLPLRTAMADLLVRLRDLVAREQATLGALAHELRTPLAALRTRLEFARLAAPGDGSSAMLDALLHDALRMQTVVDSLLLAARIEADGGRLPTAPCHPDGIIAETLRRWEPALAARGIRVRHRACGGVALASAAHLAVVVDNLVRNIADHADPAAAAGITTGIDHGRFAIVCDNGCATDAGPHPVHGRIGLPLLARIVGLMDGDCGWSQGGGRFTVTVRLRPPDPPADRR
ncbi:MAG: hypothetical protein RLZZ127_1866 [Planctomycetota bacterium]|jgi:signal transduction histidine kinase